MLVLVGFLVVSGFLRTTTQARMTSRGGKDYIADFSDEIEEGMDGNIINRPVNPRPSIDDVPEYNSESQEIQDLFETDYYEEWSNESENWDNLDKSKFRGLTDEQLKSYVQILNMWYSRLNETVKQTHQNDK